MALSTLPATLSANEAACVTGIPLKQVHRIIDSGLLDGASDGSKGRAIHRQALVGLRLAHDMTDLLTLEARRRLVRYLLDHPRARAARERVVSVDVGAMKEAVRSGLAQLARARDAVACDEAILSGVPCFRGTRIPVHDVADMLANGDDAEVIQDAFPRLSEKQVELAALYARAYPRRGEAPRWPHLAGAEADIDERNRTGRPIRSALKFLIDECLSPGLAVMARESGFLESTHVTWLGLRSRQDWALVRRGRRRRITSSSPTTVRTSRFCWNGRACITGWSA